MKGWKFMGAFYAITLFVFLISLPPDNVVYLFPPPPQPNEAIEVCFVVNPPIKSLYFHSIQSALLISSEKNAKRRKQSTTFDPQQQQQFSCARLIYCFRNKLLTHPRMQPHLCRSTPCPSSPE